MKVKIFSKWNNIYLYININIALEISKFYFSEAMVVLNKIQAIIFEGY